MMDKEIQLEYNGDYHSYLMDHYPEIHQLWCDAVNADFDSYYLYETGNTKEADKKFAEHEDLWNQYQIAYKIILSDFFNK